MEIDECIARTKQHTLHTKRYYYNNNTIIIIGEESNILSYKISISLLHQQKQHRILSEEPDFFASPMHFILLILNFIRQNQTRKQRYHQMSMNFFKSFNNAAITRISIAAKYLACLVLFQKRFLYDSGGGSKTSTATTIKSRTLP